MTPEREAELKQERVAKAAALDAESALCERVARYLMEKAGYPWDTNDGEIRHIWLNDAKHIIKLVRVDAALAEAAPAKPVSVTKLAEAFISEGSTLEEEDYDADTRQRMLVSFNAGFNAGRKSAAPAGTGTENGELIERLRSTWSTTAEQARAATAIETLTRERDGLQAANTISDRIIGELNTEVMALEDTIAELRAQLEARPTTASEEILEDALHDIVRWADAYPLTAFPEPDIAKASELLKAGGMTLDAISASNMRHVVTGVGKIARKALAAALPRSPASPEPEKGK